MQIINQYSAVWIAGFLVALAGFILLRRKPKWPQVLGFGMLVIGLAVAWVFLHPRQTDQTNNSTQILARIGQGTPVLLEFQSPY